MANISRDTFNKLKHYRKLILQQGVPWVDADFNESQDLQTFYLRKVIADCIGDGTPDDGFKIMENSVLNGGTGDLNNKFLIKAGSYYLSGYCGIFDSTQEYASQIDWYNWDSAGEPIPQVPFIHPIPALAPPPTGSRTDRVVLCLWESEVDSVEDPAILDPAIQVETSRRLKIMSFIFITSGTVPASNDTHKFVQLATISRIAGKDSIESSDITDTREDISSKLAAIDERVDNLETEMWTARGTQPSLDTRLDVVCENNGDLKLTTKEDGIIKEVNSQVIDFRHGLDVTVMGGKTVQIDIDEDELTFNFTRYMTQVADPIAEVGQYKLYAKTIDGKPEICCIDADGNVQQWTSKGHFVGGMSKEVKSWYGLLSEMPIGWNLCDGTGGRPNLINKFVQCISSVVTNPGNTGGAHSITLAIANLPAHNHGVTVTGVADHAHTNSVGTQSANHTHNATTGYQSADHGHTGATGNDSPDHSHSGTTDNSSIGEFYAYYAAGGGAWLASGRAGTTHNHTFTSGGANSRHTHSVSVGGVTANHTHNLTSAVESATHIHTVTINNAGAHTHIANSTNTGGDSSFDNRPAYYELAYIAK